MDPKILEEFNKLCTKRRYIVYQIKKAFSSIEALLKGNIDEKRAQTANAYLDEANASKTEFNNIQFKLLDFIDVDQVEFKKQEEEIFKQGEEISNLFVKYTSLVQSSREAIRCSSSRLSILNRSSDTELNANPTPRLPKIELPSFNGDIKTYLAFEGLYLNLVHNNPNLTKVQKLYYLKSSLTGDARRLVQDVELSENAYDEVWRQLTLRYNNKRMIAKSHFYDLFSIRKANNESELRRVLDSIDQALKGLKICGEQTEGWSTILSYYLSARIDDNTKRDFENSITENAIFPSFNQIRQFVEIRAINVETRDYGKSLNEWRLERGIMDRTFKKSSFNAILSEKPACIACNEQHLLIECSTFLSKTPEERFNLIRNNNRCLNCFGLNHMANFCKRSCCKFCAKKHHSLLHFDFKSTSESKNNSRLPSENRMACNLSRLSAVKANRIVILPTALAIIECGNTVARARILLDGCSQVTLITDAFVKKLKLPLRKSSVETRIHGIGGNAVCSSHTCCLKLVSRDESFELDIEAIVVPQSSLSYSVSNVTMSSNLKLLYSFKLADPVFLQKVVNVPTVDILIGAEYYESCLLNRTQRVNTVTLRETRFGWVMSGPMVSSTTEQISGSPFSFLTVADIDGKLSRFWEMEEVPKAKSVTPEMEECERHSAETYTRSETGQFIVHLPFKSKPVVLGHSFNTALKWLNRKERSSDSVSTSLYDKFMQVVLSWLAKPAKNWKTFVANRVQGISAVLSFSQWRHVPTKENPADLATRGLSAQALCGSKLWLDGPSFLLSKTLPSSYVPSIDTLLTLDKSSIRLACNVVADSRIGYDALLYRFSSYNRLLFTIARILALARSFKFHMKPDAALTVEAVNCARTAITRIVQIATFPVEYAKLEQRKPVSKRSPLSSLTPFLDTDQVIRVGGRLQKANLPYDKIHPIILPAKHHVTTLLVQHLHFKFYHASRSFLTAYLRSQYHVHGNLTNVINGIIHRCVTCIRYKSETRTQLMAQLPAARITPSRPFLHVGIDFMGPFDCKAVGHRSKVRFKIYAAIFVCFSSRACHLEIVSSLSTKVGLRYLDLQQRVRPFWSAWSRDYLSQLQTRNKWQTPKPNLEVNDIVLLKNDLLKPTFRKYGKIVELYPDSSGLVRTVAVLSEGHVKQRAISSVVLLVKET